MKAQNLSIGELPNKLQLFTRETSPNDSETLFYFIIKTGSINETDEELGYAHFLEHMAFSESFRSNEEKAY
ncbi:insulinase family protein [Tenacibaculum maritimum]|uniref:insulinase family protein n=1 Tax=Tenacibaculum maritimum TaxID=107401 RepID=UPI00388F57EC